MYRRYWRIFLVMALLSPLGLLAGGTAWGEWGAADLAKLTGFVPRGLEQAATWWQAVFPGYGVGEFGAGRLAAGAGYVASALVGAAAVYAIMLAFLRLIARFK